MVLGKFLPGELPPEKFPFINPPPIHQSPLPSLPPLPPPPRKIASQKILTWNIPTHFINCLSSLNTSFRKIFINVKTSALLRHIITKQSFK